MGLIHLDAGVVIGFLDSNDAHHEASRNTIASAIDAGDKLAISASAVAECLVGPARRGDAQIAVVHDLFARLPVAIVALDGPIATEAAKLRAKHKGLRLPDALVIATAVVAGADKLVTTDHRWPKFRKLGTKISPI